MATQEHENGHGASMKSKIYLHLKSSVCKRETKHKKRKPALILTVLCNDSLQTCFASIYGSSWKNKRLRDSMTDLRLCREGGSSRGPQLGFSSTGKHSDWDALPFLYDSTSFWESHCMALAEILVPKLRSNGDGAPPYQRNSQV